VTRSPQHLDESATLTAIRRLLFITLVVSLVGAISELLLLGHFEDAWQWTPIGLISLGFLVLAWYGLDRGPASLGVFRGLMVLFLVAGGLGVILHYRGNVEFELEMYPDMHGWKLFAETMTGATPALAPGSMVQIGLVGLAWTFRHPAFTRSVPSNERKEIP
jgi:hypothetical protein